MALIDKIRNQTAVYWEANGSDGFGGQTYKSPIELDVRWTRRFRLITDPNTGEEIVSSAEVIVGQDIELDSYMKLCSLTDLDSDSDDDPLNADDSLGRPYKVVGFESVPNKYATKFLRKALLK